MRDRAESLRAKLHELTFADAIGLATSDFEQRVQRHATGAKDNRDKLSAQLSETLIKLEQFQTDNADPLRSLDELIAERTIRSIVLSADERAKEDHARLIASGPDKSTTSRVTLGDDAHRDFDHKGPSV